MIHVCNEEIDPLKFLLIMDGLNGLREVHSQELGNKSSQKQQETSLVAIVLHRMAELVRTILLSERSSPI